MSARIEQCISCKGPLEIRELYCPDCEITVRGKFPFEARGPFARLTDDQLAFLHLFVTSRGNMSDVERSLGVSYPTVRAKLDDLIAALTDSEAVPSVDNRPTNRDEVFERVSRGELDVDEAMRLLDQMPDEDE